MITFKNYLVEARMAPLYHATRGYNAENILNMMMIEPRTFHSNRKLLKGPFHSKDFEASRGVSFTRSLRTAQQIGNVIFVLDQQKLTQKYQLKPINYFSGVAGNNQFIGNTRSTGHDDPRNEFEEFVLTNKAIPLEKYLTKVMYTASAEEYVESILKKKNIPHEVFERR